MFRSNFIQAILNVEFGEVADDDVLRPNERTIGRWTLEVAARDSVDICSLSVFAPFAVDAAIVFADRLVVAHARPHARFEVRLADIRNGATFLSTR